MSEELYFMDVSDLPPLPDDDYHLQDLIYKAKIEVREKNVSSQAPGALRPALQTVLDAIVKEFGPPKDLNSGEMRIFQEFESSANLNAGKTGIWSKGWPRAEFYGRRFSLFLPSNSMKQVLDFAKSLCMDSTILLVDVQGGDAAVIHKPKHPVYEGDSHDTALLLALGIAEPLTNDELLSRLSELSSVDSKSVAMVFDALLDLIVEESAHGRSGKVNIPQIGLFQTKLISSEPEYMAMHAMTRKPHVFPAKPARARVGFKLHTELESKLLSIEL